MAFFKFPKTPHLCGSAVVDDDDTLSEKQMASILTTALKRGLRLILQEKVDGANVGVHFEEQWQPICQKRGGVLAAHEKPQYDVFRNWTFEHMEELWDVLHTDYCMFGEWLWSTHSVHYNALPDFFIAFDILEKSSGKFVSYPRLAQLIGDRFQIVVYNGEPRPDLIQFLQGMLKNNPHSHFGNEQAEGVYVRLEDSNNVVDRYKMRRATFTCGREDFSQSNKHNELIPH